MLANCDARDPTAPGARGPGIQPRGTVDAPQALGGGFISGPSDTSPRAVSDITSNDLASFPESTWVVVNVGGQFSLSWNEAPCALRQATAPSWPCQDGSPTIDFGATAWDGGPVTLRVTYDNGGGGTVKVRGSGGAGGSSGSAVGLFFATRPGTLSGRANVNAVWAWDPFDGNGPYSWNVSGGYSVTATAVPAPFQVTENGPDASGAVTYAAEALYGLAFRNPSEAPVSWPAGALFWTFFPGDSLSDRPDLSGAGREVSACQFQLVCRYTPPGPGRMQVRAYVEERSADVRSKAIGRCQSAPGPLGSRAPRFSVDCDQSARLEVKCTPATVQRSGSVVCEVNARPRGDLTVTKWWFDDGHGYIIRPSNPQQDSAFYWGGHIVVSGTVHAEGKIDNRVVPGDSATITVQPRAWSFQYPAQPPDTWDRGDSLPYPPVSKFGEKIGDGVLGRFYSGKFEWGVAVVTSGPNEGISFMNEPPTVTTPLLILINGALEPTDPWYLAQKGPTAAHPRGCGATFLRREAPHVPAHEAGHYKVAQRFWNDPATSSEMESAVDYGRSGARVDARMDSLFRVLDRLQAHHDSTDYGMQDCDPYPLPRR